MNAPTLTPTERIAKALCTVRLLGPGDEPLDIRARATDWGLLAITTRLATYGDGLLWCARDVIGLPDAVLTPATRAYVAAALTDAASAAFELAGERAEVTA